MEGSVEQQPPQPDSFQPQRHRWVEGIDCVEIAIALPNLSSPVRILEATAESQSRLVDAALTTTLEEDETGATRPDEQIPVVTDNDTDSTQPEDGNHRSSMLHLQKGDPYGAVLWPAAISIATYLLENAPQLLVNQTVLEVGTGTGLVSLAAVLGGARRVLATDYEEIPLQLLRYAADRLNDCDSSVLETRRLDLSDFTHPLPAAQLLVAADVMYEPATGRALARRVVEALRAEAQVLIGDSPGRAGRPAFLQELQRWGLHRPFRDTVGTTVTGARHDLICGPGSTTVSATPQALVVALLHLDPTVDIPKDPTVQE